MIELKKKEDLLAIKDNRHREVVAEYLELILPLYEESPPEDIGWQLYLENAADIDVLRDVHHTDAEGNNIYVEEWGGGWEAVDDLLTMFLVTVIMNNEFGMAYFVPKGEWMDDTLKAALEERSETCTWCDNFTLRQLSLDL
ncbi:MAG: hypothetical protein DRQ62_00110 [Gammaproteobacteria bacterium]|nr:MAG: hypothetical protein DRQ62_00110 [Gammaproteobacteria bacterium]